MNVKVGWKTSEFWALVALNVGVVSAAEESSLAPHWAALCAAISVGAYALSRSLTKAAAHLGAALSRR